ncbi:hypothetical protein HXX76_013897 [Chlamydomonas incerta]|uniref:Uncharacterized protein n=1 Tax=Chlamydomonas incerta TaxID=51695 RepID=A0A835VTC7_CHLIN|nr:hypothetical protein HXX76_013897 [Chlamydomonas incerta]|eukprot:KAG2425143.1 hypothetical protein HXX76_013897 [Chlamydomonas incerta]
MAAVAPQPLLEPARSPPAAYLWPTAAPGPRHPARRHTPRASASAASAGAGLGCRRTQQPGAALGAVRPGATGGGGGCGRHPSAAARSAAAVVAAAAAGAAPAPAQDSGGAASAAPAAPSCAVPGPAAGLYGLDGDQLLQLLFEHAGLRALDFAPALPHMASSARYMQLTAANLAAWVSLMADLGVRRPALVLASCPAFLLVRLTEEEEGDQEEQEAAEEGREGRTGMDGSSTDAHSSSSSGSSSGGSSSNSGGYAELLLVPGCGGGGPDYGAAVCRFVGHCRDVLLMREEAVWGLLDSLPSLAWLHPGQVDDVITGLAPLLKGAGRGHRLAAPPPQQALLPPVGAAAASSAAASPPASPSQQPPPLQPPQLLLTEDEELDAALYHFLRRAPAVLCLSRQQMAAGVAAVAAGLEGAGAEEEGIAGSQGAGRKGAGADEGEGAGLDPYTAVCRRLCARPELLVAAALGRGPR